MRTFSYQENVPEEFFSKLAMFYTFRQVVRMSYDPRGSKSTGRDVNIARNGLSFAKNIATKYLYRPVIGDAQEINFLQSFQLSQLGKRMLSTFSRFNVHRRVSRRILNFFSRTINTSWNKTTKKKTKCSAF